MIPRSRISICAPWYSARVRAIRRRAPVPSALGGSAHRSGSGGWSRPRRGLAHRRRSQPRNRRARRPRCELEGERRFVPGCEKARQVGAGDDEIADTYRKLGGARLIRRPGDRHQLEPAQKLRHRHRHTGASVSHPDDAGEPRDDPGPIIGEPAQRLEVVATRSKCCGDAAAGDQAAIIVEQPTARRRWPKKCSCGSGGAYR